MRADHVFSRRGRLRKTLRFLFIVVLIACIFAVAGFLQFADRVATLKPPVNPQADAIVVLTGGSQRIDQAVELLRSGAGKKLLISGVHPATTGNQIRRNTQSSAKLFECCVDIGHDAIDTIGNANETARWIHENGYSRVLVVTNNYHMPRSLSELRRIDPETEFIAYPVVNSDLQSKNWLNDRMVLRVMVTEYVKTTFAWLRQATGIFSGTGLRTGASPEPAITEKHG
ncbi:YdcF family protein [Pararhizobium sp.]|uniref:YdcF family protein n=1 Tax=Pararhizobium sp. TaxID=1977563 RepID=UPI0027197081|nr:YdcF family protein [Pararhizobium sp.]MDO9417451.1 YdcF family protein [Pararhizobium sp.]